MEVRTAEYNEKYPEMRDQMVRKLRVVFEKYNGLVEYRGKYFHHMGSTSMPGMMGKP